MSEDQSRAAPTITPGDLRFAASELLATQQRFRLQAAMKQRRGAEIAAGELRRDAERLARIADRLLAEAAIHG